VRGHIAGSRNARDPASRAARPRFAPMASSHDRSRAAAEVGVATRDALRGLALQFETGAFVDARERDRRARREASAAASEALRTYQLCASAKLSREANLELVLRPVLRNFCARLLAGLGRVADRGVEADARRVADAVARDVESVPGRDGEVELMAAIERRLQSMAKDIFAGRCGISAKEAEDDDDAKIGASVARECAEALVHALAPRENVDSLVTPRVLGWARRIAAASAPGAASLAGTGEMPGEVVEIAVQVCEAIAKEADRAATLGAVSPKPNAFASETLVVWVSRLFSGTAGQDDSPGTRESLPAANARAVELLRRAVAERMEGHLLLAAPRVRAAALEAEKRARRRRAAAAAAAGIDSTSRVSFLRSGDSEDEPIPIPHDADARSPRRPRPQTCGSFRITRGEASAAVRACATREECQATLAEVPVREALAPVARALSEPSRAAPPTPGDLDKTVGGDQVVKDWLREGEGLTLTGVVDPAATEDENERTNVAALGSGFAGLDDGSGIEGDDGLFATRRETHQKLATGPFQAHFIAACGAVADALLAAGTCRVAPRREKPSPARSSAAEKARSRWFDPGSGKGRSGFEERRDRDAGDARASEREACAAAAARIVLAGSRTVRGGDALDFVMSVFAGDDARAPRQPRWMARSVDPERADRILRAAGPSTHVSLEAGRRVVVTGRDVFVVSRFAPRDERDAADEEPWAALAVLTTQTLVFDARASQLAFAERSVGLDPKVSQAALDGFLRQHEATRGRNAFRETTKTQGGPEDPGAPAAAGRRKTSGDCGRGGEAKTAKTAGTAGAAKTGV